MRRQSDRAGEAVTDRRRSDRRRPPSHAGDAPLPVSRHEAEAALARVLESPAVRASPRTAAFLAYVVGETLSGRGSRIRERDVATIALERDERFDPRIDPAVRVQAARVRTALARHYETDGAGDPIRIAVPKGGYAAVVTRAPASAPRARPRGIPEHETVGPALVVTTLADRTFDPAFQYVAPGLSETLVAVLTRFPGCRVIGPVPSAGADEDGREIGERYDAEHVVLGSVRLDARSLRITVGLVETATGVTSWSRIVDRPVGDRGSFDMVDAVASDVAAALGDYYGPLHARSTPGLPRGGDPVVRDAILRYLAYLTMVDRTRFAPALRGLEEAARREPRNALVLAMLGSMCLGDALAGTGVVDRGMERAEQLAARAIAIDPANPHAVALLSRLAAAGGRPDVARARAEQLVSMCPQHPTMLHWAAPGFWSAGEWDRGVELVRRSMEMNPNHPSPLHAIVALDLCMRGDDEGALAAAARIETPGYFLAPTCRAVALARLGRTAEAAEAIAQARAAEPGFDEQRERLLRTLFLPDSVVAMALVALARASGGGRAAA